MPGRPDLFGTEGPTRDAAAGRVRSAAERTCVKCRVMYDVSDWHQMRSQITQDWASKMSAHSGSSVYARQNGKPVVGIWGFGFDDPQRPFAPDGVTKRCDEFCQDGQVVDGFHRLAAAICHERISWSGACPLGTPCP